MKISLEWQAPIMEWDYVKEKQVPSKDDKENIFLTVGIKELSENKTYEFLDELEIAINKELSEGYGKTSFMRCSSYEDTENKALYDTCGWKRDFGNIAEQKREIIQTIRSIYKELKKKYS